MAKKRIKAPWYLREPETYEAQKREVQKAYPHLHFFPEGSSVWIRGSYTLTHEDRLLDRYPIEVEIGPEYPQELPIIKEVSGSITQTGDNHINADGSICLFVPDERWRHFPLGARLIEFFNGPVRNHFLGLSLKRLGVDWPFGERSHGREGIFESYSELLGTIDKPIIYRYLYYLSKPEIKGHWLCPCGSKKKLRHCHIELVRDLREKIPSKTAAVSLYTLLRGD
jgi:hypothetical protein